MFGHSVWHQCSEQEALQASAAQGQASTKIKPPDLLSKMRLPMVSPGGSLWSNPLGCHKVSMVPHLYSKLKTTVILGKKKVAFHISRHAHKSEFVNRENTRFHRNAQALVLHASLPRSADKYVSPSLFPLISACPSLCMRP